MLPKRIIACLDCELSVPNGRVVKGKKFKKIVYAGDPVALARKYYENGVDELVFLDITATTERRASMYDVIREVSKEVFIPICFGGGIRKIEDFVLALRAGADKVAIGTAAVETPDLINQASKLLGSQCVVISLDAKKTANKTVNCRYEVYTHGGRKATGIDAVVFAKEVERRGAGEILLNAIDSDGMCKGFDCDLVKLISEAVSIPVISSSGAGSKEDFLKVFQNTEVNGALAASIFHFNIVKIQECKNYLKENGIEVRYNEPV
ncbi:imidazole glycerol phosphate synthase subunit HisF [Candidatus Micrarchaeota archaeon]|nr:imidazole glycerol phosphate synthase subunit HisF [Candidatus Micrarchaeota archaeon]